MSNDATPVVPTVKRSFWSTLDEGFRQHVLAFLVVVSLLAAIDIATAEPYWIHWVILGWGAGLAVHFGLTRR